MPFVSLFRGNRLNIVVLTDFDRSQRSKFDRLYKAKLLERERIILATEIAEQEEADIEDFFHRDLFVRLVNDAYGLSGENVLTVEKLDAVDEKTDRLVKKVEACFRILPPDAPEFSHFDPAHHLLTHPELLMGDDDATSQTLARFERAFERISSYGMD